MGLGIEGGTDPNHFGKEPTASGRLECHVSESWGVEYAHYSALLEGRPFGGKDRNTVDALSITYRFRLK